MQADGEVKPSGPREETMDDPTDIIGRERAVTDILTADDVMPILRAATECGLAVEAAVCEDSGLPLWRYGESPGRDAATVTAPFRLEGEEVGHIRLSGQVESGRQLEAVANILVHTLSLVIASKLKRIFTSQVHAKVVQLSYEELLDANSLLKASEERYRQLAETLERRVEERTEELRDAHLRLIQQEKMTAIGQLAAGVAHEINNPLGFILSNLHTLKKYTERFLLVSDGYCRLTNCKSPADEPENRLWREMKMDYVREDALPLIRQSIEGAERVMRIVADLKGFSHLDEGTRAEVDLNGEIERTLRVLAYEIPRDGRVIRQYGDVPPFVCNPGLLCQVFLNIIRNALQSRNEGLVLSIRTWTAGDDTVLSFRDNGAGIPADIMSRVFEPFFSTRDIGAGHGLGLAVAYDIITGYGGTIEIECLREGGTTVYVTLPMQRGT
jgi:signal transduction histidine kinase